MSDKVNAARLDERLRVEYAHGQQALILRQQREILVMLNNLRDALELMNFKSERQYDELNSRLEINERSTRQIGEQPALANELRRD